MFKLSELEKILLDGDSNLVQVSNDQKNWIVTNMYSRGLDHYRYVRPHDNYENAKLVAIRCRLIPSK